MRSYTDGGWRPGPHDELVEELADFARAQPRSAVYPNASIFDAGRWVDLLIMRTGRRMIVEVKTDLRWPYQVRRAVAQVRAYGDIIATRGADLPVLVVIARAVSSRIVDGVHVLDVPGFMALFETLLPAELERAAS